MNFNFIVTEATFLRYFIPLAVAGKKRGIESCLYLMKNAKYNNPYAYLSEIERLGYPVKNISEVPADDGITFFVEGCGMDLIHRQNRKISVAVMMDFVRDYDIYIDQVEHVIFPSKYFAESFGKISDKNIYIGCPKYDVELDRESIKDKYGLTSDKNALVIFPRLRDLKKIDLNRIYGYLREDGYKVIVKTRGKDLTPPDLRGDLWPKSFRPR